MELIRNINPFDVELSTARLLLRRVKESDDNDMFEYTSDHGITKFLSWNPHTDITQTKRYIDKVIAQYDQTDCYAWAIELQERRKLIGIVRIFDVSTYNKRGELSFIVNPSFQGQGLALEAISAIFGFCFNKAGLNRIQAKCAPENYSSAKLMQNLGMKYEGTLKQFWIKKETFTDAKIYSIVAEDYRKLLSERML